MNLIIFLGLSLSTLLGSSAWGRSVKDATGTQVEVSSHPLRIVTLAPSLGELVAELLEGRTDRIVGVSEFTDYPLGLQKIHRIGPYYKFNLESVISLKPDLVLATQDGNPKDEVLHLRELKVPVVVISTNTFKEVEDSISLVGEALGSQSSAKNLSKRLHAGFENFRKRAHLREFQKISKKVALELDSNPVVVVGGGTFLNEALETVGAKNLYADSPVHYPRPAIEDLIKRDPDVILILALGSNPENKEDSFLKMARGWEQYPSLKAVKTKRVKVLRADELLRPSSRMLRGLELLEKAIYD